MFHALPPISEEVLRAKCSPAETAEEAWEIIQKLNEAMAKLSGCAGLAAPQIGINKQCAIIAHPNMQGYVINPTILEAKDVFTSEGEGCMSFPGRYFNVPRFRHFSFESDALWSHDGDRKAIFEPDTIPGKPMRFIRRVQSIICDPTNLNDLGIGAIVVQHEIDHIRPDGGICLPWKEGAVEVKERLPEQVKIDLNTIVPGLFSPKNKSVGRNDPCPCGSNVKFKKCCGK